MPSCRKRSSASRSPPCSARPTCPADGQHFLTAGPGEALSAHNARYGHERSAPIYTHTSARHAPFHAVAIPPAGGAAYVIDGLFHHEADLSTLTHHTDGGGVSDHNFALTALLGVRFAPRIPNIADYKLYAFGPASTWPALAPFIAGRPDERLIAAHWADVLRFTCSVRTGVVSASLMLKRLGAYPRKKGLALALRLFPDTREAASDSEVVKVLEAAIANGGRLVRTAELLLCGACAEHLLEQLHLAGLEVVKRPRVVHRV